MPAVASNDFVVFTRQIGLRKEHAEALWQADIRTPQELGSLEADRLKEICNNPLLVNVIHPLLRKYIFSITTADDPFKRALKVIKKNLPKEDEDMEVVGTASDAIENDAEGYRDSALPLGATPERREPTTTTFGNTQAKVSASGNHVAQSFIGDEKEHKKMGIQISGGNFVQANIMGKGPVTYNNTNTVISTTLGSGADHGMRLDLKSLRQKKLNESFVLDGNLIRMKDVDWMSGGNYWIGDDLRVVTSAKELYDKSYRRKDVYRVGNFGQNRALIINNYEFEPQTRMTKRNGAGRDTENMKNLLHQLGFQVTCVQNQTKDAIMQALREFAENDKNRVADMVAVYIGSHGERDDQGCDTFIGVDGGRVKFEEVKELFSPLNSPFLDDKPKIFFLQFCRQDSSPKPAQVLPPISDSRTGSDGKPFVDDDDGRLMDFLCVYATLAGNKAYRDTLDGSWFVSCLVRVLSENAKTEDLQSMLTQVNNSVSEKEGNEGHQRALQISEVVHNLRRKIYFWPGMK